MKPIITIKEARKILGEKYKNMSDEEIERIVNDLHMIAKLTIEQFRREREQAVGFGEPTPLSET